MWETKCCREREKCGQIGETLQKRRILRKDGLLARPSRSACASRGCMGKMAERKGSVGRNQEEKKAKESLRRGVCSRELSKRTEVLSEQGRASLRMEGERDPLTSAPIR